MILLLVISYAHFLTLIFLSISFPRCVKPFKESDVVPLNPPKEEANLMRARLFERRRAEKAVKVCAYVLTYSYRYIHT